MQGINLVLGFWLGEAHMMFTTPSLSFRNGWLWIMLLMLQGQHYLHFTFSKVQGCKKTTFKIVDQEHAWQCKKRLRWQLTFSSNGWFFFVVLFQRGMVFMLQYKQSIISSRNWVRHGHLTYSYFTYVTTIGCHLLQTIQDNF